MSGGSPPETINLNPGPVPLSEATREAMLGELVSHRSPEFEALHRACVDGLKTVFGTDEEVILVNGNGNVGLELAVANCVHPGDRVLCLRNGKFGDNLVDLVSRHTGDVAVVGAEWGQPVGLDAVEEAIDDSVDLVVTTHCETSTGMLNPAKEVAALAEAHGALSMVDGVSSVGGEPLPVDEWGVDLAVVAAQKCLSAPPGLSAVSVSGDARARWRANPRTMPYNLDLGRYRQAAASHQTPSTAPVPAVRALRQSLDDILDAGLEAAYSQRARQAAALRRAGASLGFEVFPEPDGDARVSNTVTVLEVPEPLTAPALVSALAEEGLLVRTGIGPMRERTVRLATMSEAVTDAAVVGAIDRLRSVVEATGQSIDSGGIAAARERLDAGD